MQNGVRPTHKTKWVRIVYSQQSRSSWKNCEDQIVLYIEPTLFKIVIPHECLEKLSVLLGDNNYLATSSHASVLDLPTNDDVPTKVFVSCNWRHTIKFFS